MGVAPLLARALDCGRAYWIRGKYNYLIQPQPISIPIAPLGPKLSRPLCPLRRMPALTAASELCELVKSVTPQDFPESGRVEGSSREAEHLACQEIRLAGFKLSRVVAEQKSAHI